MLAALALPAAIMLHPVVVGGEPWRAAIRPTGLLAAQLLVGALCIAPLRALFPHWAWLAFVERRRRWIGLAAFAYAALHMIAFCLAIGRLDYILEGLAFASMWTGWLSFAALLAVASISSDAARRRLGRNWKRTQRLAWAAAALAFVHWLLLVRTPLEPVIWFAPLALLLALRLWKRVAKDRRTER